MFGFRRQLIQKTLTVGVKLRRKFSMRKDGFMSGDNAAYAEQMFEQWQKDHHSVHVSWHVYFSNIARGMDAEAAYQEPPFDDVPLGNAGLELHAVGAGQAHVSSHGRSASQIRLIQMIDLYRRKAHLVADLDPLKIEENRVHQDEPFYKLISNPELFDFKADQLNKPITIEIKDNLFTGRKSWSPLEIAQKLEEIYTGPITFEYMHIPDRDAVQWIQGRVEANNFRKQSREEKEYLLHRLAESQALSDILDKKYPSSKKYGAEGCDSGITGMEYLADVANEAGVRQVIVGMPHRGRFNIMTGMFKKSYAALFTAFNDLGVENELHANEWGYSSDVKYHMQANTTKEGLNGNKTDLVSSSLSDFAAKSEPS